MKNQENRAFKSQKSHIEVLGELVYTDDLQENSTPESDKQSEETPASAEFEEQPKEPLASPGSAKESEEAPVSHEVRAASAPPLTREASASPHQKKRVR